MLVQISRLEKKTCFYQAFVSELYGLVQEVTRSETTSFNPSSRTGAVGCHFRGGGQGRHFGQRQLRRRPPLRQTDDPANIVQAAHDCGAAKLMMLASSCIYTKSAPGRLEPSQPVRRHRKQRRDQAWRGLPPSARLQRDRCHADQPLRHGDNFDLDTSLVLPALIRKAHEAKASGATSFTIWGTGTGTGLPKREFLHDDDCAAACVHLMKVYSDAEHVNVGPGDDTDIYDLTVLVTRAVSLKERSCATCPSLTVRRKTR